MKTPGQKARERAVQLYPNHPSYSAGVWGDHSWEDVDQDFWEQVAQAATAPDPESDEDFGIRRFKEITGITTMTKRYKDQVKLVIREILDRKK